MKDYIYESIAQFSEMYEKVSSPYKKVLKNINENSPILDKQEVDTLHFIATKLLWVKEKGIPDIEPVIYFLRTRVTKITVEDKGKSNRVLQFLK